jgi:4-phosphopantoate--beta-alanine ligase
VRLGKVTSAKLEVNLFHRLPGREEAINKILKEAGAKEILGIGEAASERIDEVFSERRRVDPRGIFIADVVFVPLEDGDRTQGLVRMGKKVVTVDLNPMSRTAQLATITIVDNIVRAIPLMALEAEMLRDKSQEELQRIVLKYDHNRALSDAMGIMMRRLRELSKKGVYISLG